jgi:hypothetical protein
MSTTVKIDGIDLDPADAPFLTRVSSDTDSVEFALAESPTGSGIYAGSATATLPDGLYYVEVRGHATNTATFDSSTTVVAPKQYYDGPGAYLVAGAWYAAPTSGSAGDGTIVAVSPLQIAVTNPRFSVRDLLPIVVGATPSTAFTATDALGQSLDLTGKLVRFVASTVVQATPPDPTTDVLTAAFKYETSGSGITISGQKNNIVTVTHSSSEAPGNYLYELWDITDNIELARGQLTILPGNRDVP